MNSSQKIKVSVSCKAFNHGKYIRQTLEGFVSQKTNFQFEVIVHDDASTDNTCEIIREYAEKYPDIIKPIYQKENQYSKRVPAFKVFMLPKMQGKYIAFCEGDDYWCDCYKLQKQVDFLDSHPEYSACAHNSIWLDYYKNEVRLYNKSLEAFDLETVHVVKDGGAYYHTSAVMYRMEFAREVQSDKRPEFFGIVKNVGDYPLSIYLTLKGKVRYLPDVMSVYRYGVPGSWTKRMENRDHFMQTQYSIVEMLKSVDKYTEFKIHDTIQPLIDERCQMLLNIETKIGVLYSEDMKKVFNEQTIIQKLKILMKLLFINRIRYCR